MLCILFRTGNFYNNYNLTLIYWTVFEYIGTIIFLEIDILY